MYIIKFLRVPADLIASARPLLCPTPPLMGPRAPFQPMLGSPVPAPASWLESGSPALSLPLPLRRILALLCRLLISWMDPQTQTSFCPLLASLTCLCSLLDMPGVANDPVNSTQCCPPCAGPVCLSPLDRAQPAMGSPSAPNSLSLRELLTLIAFLHAYSVILIESCVFH